MKLTGKGWLGARIVFYFWRRVALENPQKRFERKKEKNEKEKRGKKRGTRRSEVSEHKST